MHIRPSSSRHLSRTHDGYVAGVCGGIGRHFGISPTFIRLIWLVAALAGFGTGLVLYALLWWLMPQDGFEPITSTAWVRGADGTYHAPLFRSREDRKVLGVCGALARRWNVDPTLVRLAALTVLTVSFGLATVAYFVAAVLIPSAPLQLSHTSGARP